MNSQTWWTSTSSILEWPTELHDQQLQWTLRWRSGRLLGKCVCRPQSGYTIGKLSELNEVLWRMQLTGCILKMLKANFDSVLKSYLDLDGQLSSDAKIVESQSIEARGVKLQDEQKGDITTAEHQALLKLLLQCSGKIDVERNRGFIIKMELKSLHSEDDQRPFRCLDTCFLIPTSIFGKRLSTIASSVLSNCRNGILMANLEGQLLIFYEQDFLTHGRREKHFSQVEIKSGTDEISFPIKLIYINLN